MNNITFRDNLEKRALPLAAFSWLLESVDYSRLPELLLAGY